MARIKSDNRHLAILTGYETRHRHSAVAETVTIAPRSGEFVVLHGILLGSTTASAIVVRDADGVKVTLKASVAEGPYPFNIKCKGSLIVENPGGSDILIVFSND